MTTSSWGLGRRIAFRFGFVLAALVTLPFPLNLLPKTDWLDAAWIQPWHWGVSWLAAHVFGIPDPPTAFNGSGDRPFEYLQLLLFAIVAALGTVVWSIADRRRTSYARLATATWVVLRYSLASAMLTYGSLKIARMQFSALGPGRLAGTVGDMSPMGLLWTFMGYSWPYTVFAALLEAIGGTLLLWRRTTMIGAAMVAAVMFNVTMLNLCYDVPVKLYSIELFITAVVIAAPRARPLIAAMLGRAAAEAPARTRMSPRWERARLIVKVAVLGLLTWHVYQIFDEPRRDTIIADLHGIWIVDSFTLDGRERTLATDGERWQRVAFNPYSVWVFPTAGFREALPIKADTDNREVIVTLADRTRDKDRPMNKDGKPGQEIWKYHRSAPDHLELDGEHRGHRFHMAGHLLPEPLLITRGFRWINEAPFNR